MTEFLNTITGRSIPIPPKGDDFVIDPDQIELLDIAWGLCGLHRFAAQTRWSVAQHTLFVMELARTARDVIAISFTSEINGERMQQLLALHDASEYLCVDLPGPIKRKIRYHDEIYSSIEETIARAIHERFNVEWPTHLESAWIKFFDRAALAFEHRTLMPGPHPLLPSLPNGGGPLLHSQWQTWYVKSVMTAPDRGRRIHQELKPVEFATKLVDAIFLLDGLNTLFDTADE